MNIIEVKNLSFDYDQSRVLGDLSFAVEKGSFLSIAGPNGAGKSTLLNLLSANLKPGTGTVSIDDTPVGSYSAESLARKIAVVGQEFVPVFGFSVIETVLMARIGHYGRWGFETKADREIVRNALKATDTEQFASRQLGQISGGERQRVFIARALAQDTPVLLLDEPTSFLDLQHQVRIYDLLKQMQVEQNKTIVAITHDINLAGQYCDEVLLLGSGTDYHKGPSAEVFSAENLEKVFDVTGFSGQVGKENFFLPLGKFAKDNQNKNC